MYSHPQILNALEADKPKCFLGLARSTLDPSTAGNLALKVSNLGPEWCTVNICKCTVHVLYSNPVEGTPRQESFETQHLPSTKWPFRIPSHTPTLDSDGFGCTLPRKNRVIILFVFHYFFGMLLHFSIWGLLHLPDLHLCSVLKAFPPQRATFLR